MSTYTDDELLARLIDFHHDTGKVPTIRSLKGKLPSPHTIINRFGTFKKALELAGLFELREDINTFKENHSDETLINNLKEYMIGRETVPNSPQLQKDFSNPNWSAYCNRFGTRKEVFAKIGIDLDKQDYLQNQKLELDMINKFKNLEKLLGRTPHSRDINKYSKLGICYAMGAYAHHFGGILETQLKCGMKPTHEGVLKNREDLLNDLHMIYKITGKPPVKMELKHYDNVAPVSRYISEFGGWTESLIVAGFKPNNKIYYSKIHNTKCHSYYEWLFINMLESNNINFTKEDMYSDYIKTNRKYRFDFKIKVRNKTYFIEIFGITGNKSYNKTREVKKDLCKKNNLNLIKFLPSDFKSHNTDDLYEVLNDKIIEMEKAMLQGLDKEI